MKNACSLPVPPVNIVLPLPLTPSPKKPLFTLGDPEHRTPHRRRRSSTFAAIKNWALAVQPGSPIPLSPHNTINLSPGTKSRRSSISAARDFISRRTSISHHRAASNSSVALLVETPRTSGHRQDYFDLTNLGYTAIFLPQNQAPSTPSPFLLRDPFPSLKEVSVQKEQSKGLKRIKSLGMLSKRNRRKSVSAAAVDPKEPVSRPRSHSRSKSALVSAHSKKSFAHPPLPPTLASELLMRQFFDGGSLEKHAKRAMEEQARQAAPAGFSKGTPLPVGTLYRDENGTLWQDEDERLEREALLSSGIPDSPAREWTTFNSSGKTNLSPVLPGMALGVGADFESEERRGSFASVTSSLSLSPHNIVTPADASSYTHQSPQPSYPDLPSPLSGYGTVRPPGSPTTTLSTITGMAAATGAMAQNKRNRRRPAPLRLNGPSIRDAFDDSFIPSPRAMALASVERTDRRRSSTGALGLSAPPACTEFTATSFASGQEVKGDASLKENLKADRFDSASLITMGPKKALGLKKISKLNLKSMKSLFGGA
ncbi:hypothetical protein F5890DRAFT_486318 [Lentinula detonsa]|uniref:Uncharacterized protein n=1 Tax=Lentinula detonsa TaxID=2804962 RepID=A0AA38UPB1_9AGAR|nr:hypothetical protein F5890DRAFT_486318 [Lentinula detonsa]